MESDTKNNVTLEQCIREWCVSIANEWVERGQSENDMKRFAFPRVRLMRSVAIRVGYQGEYKANICLDAFIAYVKEQRQICFWHNVVRDD